MITHIVNNDFESFKNELENLSNYRKRYEVFFTKLRDSNYIRGDEEETKLKESLGFHHSQFNCNYMHICVMMDRPDFLKLLPKSLGDGRMKEQRFFSFLSAGVGVEYEYEDELRDSCTPLCLAIALGRKECADVLLEMNCDYNTPDLYGTTPLMFSDIEFTKKLLLKRDLDINAPNYQRKTAFELALINNIENRESFSLTCEDFIPGPRPAFSHGRLLDSDEKATLIFNDNRTAKFMSDVTYYLLHDFNRYNRNKKYIDLFSGPLRGNLLGNIRRDVLEAISKLKQTDFNYNDGSCDFFYDMSDEEPYSFSFAPCVEEENEEQSHLEVSIVNCDKEGETRDELKDEIFVPGQKLIEEWAKAMNISEKDAIFVSGQKLIEEWTKSYNETKKMLEVSSNA